MSVSESVYTCFCMCFSVYESTALYVEKWHTNLEFAQCWMWKCLCVCVEGLKFEGVQWWVGSLVREFVLRLWWRQLFAACV